MIFFSDVGACAIVLDKRAAAYRGSNRLVTTQVASMVTLLSCVWGLSDQVRKSGGASGLPREFVCSFDSQHASRGRKGDRMEQT
jgi:hypothetical protein